MDRIIKTYCLIICNKNDYIMINLHLKTLKNQFY